MNWMSALPVLLFLVLWLAPILAIRRAARRGRDSSRVLRVVVPAYVLALLGLAIWWRVPFAAQNDVEAAASSWAAAPRGRLSCPEVQAGAAALGRASRGQIEATADGNLRLPAGIWRRLPERERTALIALTAQMRRCLGNRATAEGAAIYDIETNRILFEANSAAGR